MHRLSSWLHLPINRRSSNKGAKEVNMPISTERPPPPPFKGKNNRPIAREITNHLPSSVNKNETKMQKQLVRKISLANKSANVDESELNFVHQ
jgi:hypothetical protein